MIIATAVSGVVTQLTPRVNLVAVELSNFQKSFEKPVPEYCRHDYQLAAEARESCSFGFPWRPRRHAI